jgi:hypothetical protein
VLVGHDVAVEAPGRFGDPAATLPAAAQRDHPLGTTPWQSSQTPSKPGEA